ncbi:MAG: cytochrome c oxidase accessory protein CcoG [Methylophilaceae bacterium]|nr:cytochrome c oxidase accessory protein CcoG [Methylophilaceae bacterium]
MSESSAHFSGPLFQKRIPIYTRSVRGRFRNFKTGVLMLAYTVFFSLPWVPWTRASAPDQAIMFDLGSRRFFIFDLVVYPQDVFWLALLLFIAATFLFFVTELIGRAWCGYFCFQTLWLDCFMLIERLIQGERPARMRLAKQPWNAEKVLKVGGSHALMLLISFWTAFTFVAYFTHAPQFLHDFFHGTAHSTAYLAVTLITISTYVAGAIAREQVCTHICPYARFQSVMYDHDTLAPNYDVRRGEGRSGRALPQKGLKTREERHAKGHGDCVDCGYCVQVCPTGVDIRHGLQYQCISCGLCIDACNTIMDSLGWERGLIRYDSENNLHSAKPTKPRIVWRRTRVLVNGLVLALMVGFLGYRIATRSLLEVTVEQERQPLYVQLSDDRIRNRYKMHIVNKTEHEERYVIRVRGIPEEALDTGAEDHPVVIRSGKDLRLPIRVDLDAEMAKHIREFEFEIVPLSEPEQKMVRKVNFYSAHRGHETHN